MTTPDEDPTTSVHNPKVRKALMDIAEAAHPDTDEAMRTVRALLINREILDDPFMGIVYTGVAIGMLMRMCVTDTVPPAAIIDAYRARLAAWEKENGHGD